MVLLNLSSKGSPNPQDFEINYDVPLEFSPNSEVALISCNIPPFRLQNCYLSKTHSTNKLRYFDGTNWKTIVFPEGRYDLDDIMDYMRKQFQSGTTSKSDDDCPILIDDSTVYEDVVRVTIVLEHGYKLDLTEEGSGKWHEMLGFDPEVIDQPETVSKYGGDILRKVDRLFIHCSIIGDSYVNAVESDIIYSYFTFATPEGNLYGIIQDFTPPHPVYLPLKSGLIRKIRMSITDQDNRPINFGNGYLNFDRVHYLLNIRKIK